MPEPMTAIFMFYSIEAGRHGERSTLSQLSNHGQSFGNVPICREL
jgi:hypothetical protein